MATKMAAFAATALCAVLPAAHAQSYTCEPNCYQDWPLHLFTAGSIVLTETEDQAGAWDLLGVSAHAPAGSGTTLTQTLVNPPDAGYPRSSWSQPITASAFTDAAVQAVWAGTTGIEYTQGSNTVTIKNLKLDTSSGSVYADLFTADGSFLNQPFLVQGPTTEVTGHPGAFDSNVHQQSVGGYSGLILSGSFDTASQTAAGTLGILSRGLGLRGQSPGLLNSISFADVSYSANYVDGFFDLSKPLPGIPSVPEPTTVALLAAGFATFVARKATL